MVADDGGDGGLRRINPDGLAPPSGFSHAVAAAAPGGVPVFVAGQTATDEAGRIVGADVVAQFTRALDNLLTALRAAGAGPEQLAGMTVYVRDVAAYRAEARALGRVWRERCGPRYPAMAVVQVGGLWDEEALVELQATAVRPG